jgi:hypothetical protein
MQKTPFSAKVTRRKVILAIGSKKGTWQRSIDIGGIFLRRKGKVE